MNIFNFTGNIGSDCETRYTADGKAIATWSVAVQSGYGKLEKTNWIRCTMFGDRGAKLAGYLTKGTQVAVSGEISLNEFVNKAGENKANIDCVVSSVTLLGKKESAMPLEERQRSKLDTSMPSDDFESESIPF
jgi:single-strand DNA-binding protein